MRPIDFAGVAKNETMTLFHDRMGRSLSLNEAFGKGIGRVESIVLDVELLLLTLVGCIPLHFFRKLMYSLAGIRIGKQSTIHMWARFYDPRGITIGRGTIIGDHAFLDGRHKLQIGNHVDIASQVLIYNGEHDIHSEDFAPVFESVVIEDYVFIGPRAIILPGVTIGKGAIVGAGAVVTRDVEPFTIVGGIPASVIGKRRNTNPHYRLGRYRLFQ